MDAVRHRTTDELASALDAIRAAPRERGLIELITRRPAPGDREILDEATLDPQLGLVGDGWPVRPSSRTKDRSPHPEMQLTIMSVRVIAAIAGERDAWPLAGDQLFADFDLGSENVPPGTRLAIGGALVEVTEQPHTGCAKFLARFGSEAARWINTPLGRALNLRGVNARVLTGGVVRRGDAIAKLP